MQACAWPLTHGVLSPPFHSSLVGQLAWGLVLRGPVSTLPFPWGSALVTACYDRTGQACLPEGTWQSSPSPGWRLLCVAERVRWPPLTPGHSVPGSLVTVGSSPAGLSCWCPCWCWGLELKAALGPWAPGLSPLSAPSTQEATKPSDSWGMGRGSGGGALVVGAGWLV